MRVCGCEVESDFKDSLLFAILFRSGRAFAANRVAIMKRFRRLVINLSRIIARQAWSALRWCDDLRRFIAGSQDPVSTWRPTMAVIA